MRKRTNKQALLLFVIATGMFGFAFALVPLYDVFCQLTGLNGKTSSQASLRDEIRDFSVAIEREVRIEFLAKVARGMPWEFRPMDDEMTVLPGKMYTTTYFARNLVQKHVTGQAVPSITPGQAAQYVKKIECFCFEQQGLPAGGETEMSVSFFVDADLPAEISELTLSYTMFHVDDVDHDHQTAHVTSHRE